jgi:hypothetical protein
MGTPLQMAYEATISNNYFSSLWYLALWVLFIRLGLNKQHGPLRGGTGPTAWVGIALQLHGALDAGPD